MKLTGDQMQILYRYQKLIKEALSDLTDSMKTTYMSESKSSVYALKQEACFEGLPSDVAEELLNLSSEAWMLIIKDGSTYDRAARTISKLGEIERYVDTLMRCGWE